jgi:class 3 adenylate cyclase/tetratricopeptide (TPR) repeat protein
MPDAGARRLATATVLFVDLAGSTAQRVALGDDAADDLTAAFDRMSRDTVVAHDGNVLKGTGDGLMAVFTAASDAVGAAVAIHQAAEQHNRRVDEPRQLSIRIGCSAGDVQFEAGDCRGTPVVEAARLEAASTAGEIWVSDLVRSLVGSRGTYIFESVGTFELKGLAEPLTAHRVPWEPVVEAPVPGEEPGDAAGAEKWRVPLPHRLEPGAAFVGRVSERAVMDGALGAVEAEGRRRVVLLGGEPGIGKTALAATLAATARGDGAVVLYGRSDEDLGIPYQPWTEALAHLVRHAPEAVLSAHVSARGGVLVRLVPELGERVSASPLASSDPEAERYLVFGAVVDLLERVSSAVPVVIVLDDLHWADVPSLQLLHHVVGAEAMLRVLVAVTYRDTDVADDAPLAATLASLYREPGIERISVVGLDDAGVVALLEAIAGHEMGDDGIELAQLVTRETGGNPFFAAEVLRHLAETGAISQEDGRWVAKVDFASIGLPESVREVVDQRVRRLGEDAHRILTVASVIGRDFDLRLLARAAERDEDDVLDMLEEAATAAVVVEVQGRAERFTFTHALFQHTLYDELSASRRSRAHRRIGELLEADWGEDPGDHIGELAYHWVAAATPAEAGKAAGYAQRAGKRALEALAPEEAIRWFHQAVDLLDGEPGCDPHQRLDAVVGLGDAQRQAGDPAYRETLLAAAAEATRLGDTDHLVAAALANQRGGWASNTGAVDAERIATLEQALDALVAGDSQARALLLATLAAELTFSGELDRRRALAAEAESMARRLGDDAALLRVLNVTFVPLWVPDDFPRTVAASAEAVVLSDRVGDPVARFGAAQNRLFAMASSAERAGIDAAIALAESLAGDIGQPYLTWLVTYGRCWVALMAGDADEADRLATSALQIGSDSGQPDAFTVYGGNLLNIRWHQGRMEEMLPLIEQAAADNPGVPAFQAVYAQTLCECGRTDEAKPLLAAASSADFHDAAYDYIWLTNTTFWADTAAWLGDTSAAGVLFDRLAPYEPQGILSGATFTGTVGMYLARLATVLGRLDEANDLFARTDGRLRALAAPFFQARNQVEWARLLSTRGGDHDVHRARDLLAEASATAARYGCAGIERRVKELVAAVA